MGTWGMGTPVEIEFAVNMPGTSGKNKEFGLLQMRPLVINREIEELNVDDYNPKQLICMSDQVLGNGVMTDIRDIILVDRNKFDRSKSRIVAQEVSSFNSKMIAMERPYLLIGMGRWGTLDPWLGIPVNWEQISGARAIVEAGFKEFSVTPSQGSHFFQNITSFMVGYFTVNEHMQKGSVNWEWLYSQPVKESMEYTRWINFSSPLTIKMNGHHNRGVILKPE
jgi:hypothetical protein